MGDSAPVSRWAQRKQQREQMYASSSDAIKVRWVRLAWGDLYQIEIYIWLASKRYKCTIWSQVEQLHHMITTPGYDQDHDNLPALH